jgi:enoyl-CoA hydratase/carnithine racemase
MPNAAKIRGCDALDVGCGTVDHQIMNAASPPNDTQERLLVDRLGGVCVLRLNRPAQRNALSEALIADLTKALHAIGADKAVRAVVLAAVGPVFCAGHDLRELSARRVDGDAGRGYFATVFARCSQLMQVIVALPQPVIAAVEGMATATGCQLVASCDLAVAGEAARFATPGVHIGLFCSTPMVALSRNIAPKHAMEMLLMGDPISAVEAARLGLVNKVAPAGGAFDEAMAWARQIAAKSAPTLRLGKRAFYDQLELPLAAAYDHAARVMVENMLAGDACEGIDAFLDKRAPQWREA